MASKPEFMILLWIYYIIMYRGREVWSASVVDRIAEWGVKIKVWLIFDAQFGAKEDKGHFIAPVSTGNGTEQGER